MRQRGRKRILVAIIPVIGLGVTSNAVAGGETANEAAISEPSTAASSGEETDLDLCKAIEVAAEENGLPVGFFTRLIWKESRFRSDAVSPKGAQGIAQFMPGTAEERGLADPFDLETAIQASASYLADLQSRFGNLGLAAAAYNAGADRVSDWLADNATLPYETQDYVLFITGVSAETWAVSEEGSQPADSGTDCLALAAHLKAPAQALGPDIETAGAPWGVQVTANFSKARAVGTYTTLQKRYPDLLADRSPMIVGGRMPGRGTRAVYRIRVPMQTREEADGFCKKLRAAGGSCVVLKT